MSHASRILDLLTRATNDKALPAKDGISCQHCRKLTVVDQHELCKVVQCTRCQKNHRVKDNSYLTFEGNVYVGTGGGLIGDNFDDDGRIKRVTVVCRTRECLEPLLGLDEEFIG